MSTQDKLAESEQAQKIVAKPLEWEESDIPEWFDKNACGFYISREDDGSDEPYSAAWGEGESETFATLEDAKEWCQGQIDSWVRENAMLAASPQQAAEPVAWMHPELHKGHPYPEECLSTEAFDDWLPLYTHPQPAQDAKDAARYRWLRKQSVHQNNEFEILHYSDDGQEAMFNEGLDRAIDAAMAKEFGR